MEPRIGCILMASGLSRRFGSDKLIAPFRGRPLLLWALDATDGLFDRRLILTRSAAAAQLARDAGTPVRLHELPRRCDAIRLGLEDMKEMDGCLFCPCDQPLLRRETVARLAAAFSGQPWKIWRPAFEEQPGAPMLFPQWAFEELAALENGGGRAVVARHPEAVRTLPVESPWELRDIDTPQELALLEQAAARLIAD